MLHALLVSVLSAMVLTTAPLPRVTVPAFTGRSGGPMALVDSIVVEKKAHRMTLFRDGRPARSYLVALGAATAGDKVRAGDRRTPEGVFYIDSRQPFSKYHLALHISYPDAAHRARSAAMGTVPGGDIMIHGLPNGMGDAGSRHLQNDWTDGCVALTDQEIEEIWSIVPIGTPVEIKP